MARTRPHFKIHTTVLHHQKMSAIIADNELFGLWVKLAVLAIERYAAKNDNRFTVSHAELLGLTNRKRIDKALLILRKVVDNSTLTMSSHNRNVVITFPKLSEKQGFHPKKVQESTPTNTIPIPIYNIGVEGASMSDEQIAAMVAVRPGGALYSEADVRAWVEWIGPQIAMKGFSDVIKTTLAWWPSARADAVDRARRWTGAIRLASARDETPEEVISGDHKIPDDIFRDIEGDT